MFCADISSVEWARYFQTRKDLHIHTDAYGIAHVVLQYFGATCLRLFKDTVRPMYVCVYN